MTALAFASTSLPVSAAGIALSVYLPRHYASHLGLDLALVGSAFFLVRMIDIPVDGLLGWTMDKTRTRLGRYRVWTILGAPVLMTGLYFLFLAEPGVSRLYFISWLLVLYMGTSILALSHAAWAATLAPQYNDRSRLFGIMTAIGVCGAASVLAIPIVNDGRGVSDAVNVPAMGWFLLLLTPVTAAIVAAFTPEKIAPEIEGHEFRLRDYGALITRPTFMRVLLADLCLALGPGWMSASYLFYFTDARGFTTGQASILLASYILAGIVGAPLMGRLAIRISKHRALMVSSTGFAFTILTFPLIPQGSLLTAFFPLFLAGVFAAGFNVLGRAMTADIADEVRLEQGKERSGLLYAITTMTTKIAGAFSIGLTFFVLSKVGYDARLGAGNTAEAIRNLEWAFLAGPVFFVALGGACMVGYRLGADRHAEIRRQLNERDALYDEAPIVETVTAEAAIVAPSKSV